MNSLDRIFSATIDLSYETGVNGTATARIAREAKVANGTLFHHFPTKKDLVEYCYMRIQEDYVWNMIGFLDLPSHTTRKQLKKAIKTAIDYWVRNPKYFVFTQRVNHSQFYSERLQKKLSKLQLSLQHAINQGIQQKAIRKLDHHVMTSLLFKAIYDVAQLIMDTPDKTKQIEYREQGFSFIWAAIK